MPTGGKPVTTGSPRNVACLRLKADESGKYQGNRLNAGEAGHRDVVDGGKYVARSLRVNNYRCCCRGGGPRCR